MSYTIIPRAIDLQSLPDEETINLNNSEKLEIKPFSVIGLTPPYNNTQGTSSGNLWSGSINAFPAFYSEQITQAFSLNATSYTYERELNFGGDKRSFNIMFLTETGSSSPGTYSTDIELFINNVSVHKFLSGNVSVWRRHSVFKVEDIEDGDVLKIVFTKLTGAVGANLSGIQVRLIADIDFKNNVAETIPEFNTI